FATDFLFYCFAHHRDLHSFPTRRSSDLRHKTIRRVFYCTAGEGLSGRSVEINCPAFQWNMPKYDPAGSSEAASASEYSGPPTSTDRKSTRLNSSHVKISYAVFCLKKKKN